MGRLDRKVVFITGATGIAAAAATLFAREGASCFVASMVPDECEQLVRSLREHGGRSDFAAGDLAEAGFVAGAVKRCEESLGPIDCLFNVAGISGRRFGDGPVHECSEDGWDRTMRNNARSCFLVCREVVGRMMVRPAPANGGSRGAVLNMGSVLALSPQPDHFATVAYAASKGAIVSMSRAMAAYYGPQKIRVNVVAPGLVRTPMSRRAQDDPAVMDFIRTKQPLAGDLVEADDVAQLALFLLSDESRRITGSVCTVDGGWTVS